MDTPYNPPHPTYGYAANQYIGVQRQNRLDMAMDAALDDALGSIFPPANISWVRLIWRRAGIIRSPLAEKRLKLG